MTDEMANLILGEVLAARDELDALRAAVADLGEAIGRLERRLVQVRAQLAEMIGPVPV